MWIVDNRSFHHHHHHHRFSVHLSALAHGLDGHFSRQRDVPVSASTGSYHLPHTPSKSSYLLPLPLFLATSIFLQSPYHLYLYAPHVQTTSVSPVAHYVRHTIPNLSRSSSLDFQYYSTSTHPSYHHPLRRHYSRCTSSTFIAHVFMGGARIFVMGAKGRA